jgi:hypothetical protein
METKKEYMAPELTVVSFKTERGYAGSGFSAFQLLSAMIGIDNSNIETMELYSGTDAFDQNELAWQ